MGCASAAESPSPSPTGAPPPPTGSNDESTGDPEILTTGIDPPDPDGSGGGDGTTTTGRGGEDDSTSTGDGGDESTTGETDDGTTTSATAGGEPCEPDNTCNSSEVEGGVSGDTATPPLNVMGDRPTWLQVQVSENDSGVFATGMSATVTLTSVQGDWDLRAFLGAPGDTNGCGGEEQRSETTAVDSVGFDWGESGTFANNTDDGTFIAVEIFPKDDVCLPDGAWTLVVTGNS